MLLRRQRGETPEAVTDRRDEGRSTRARKARLGGAAGGGSRRDMLGECWWLMRRSGPYADSTEELSPVRLDWISAVPLAMIATVLLAAPKRGVELASGAWGALLLDFDSARMIDRKNFGEMPSSG